MVRTGSFYGIRSSPAIDLPKGDAGAPAPKADSVKEWYPADLVDNAAIRRIRHGVPLREVLPAISADSMRLRLYRDFKENGKKEFSGLDVSVEWTTALLIYSAMNMVQDAGESRGMKVYDGYPNLLESGLSTFGGDKDEFRIYARTQETALDIVTSQRLLASHRGYITDIGNGLAHFRDLTGVFITKPGVAPKRVGVSGYEFFVDFTLSPSVPRLKIKEEPAYLIPGPPRLSREEIAAGLDGASRDAMELMQMFSEGLPAFAIPIEVTGHGRLEGISPVPTVSSCAARSALTAAGISLTPSLIPNPVLRHSFVPRF